MSCAVCEDVTAFDLLGTEGPEAEILCVVHLLKVHRQRNRPRCHTCHQILLSVRKIDGTPRTLCSRCDPNPRYPVPVDVTTVLVPVVVAPGALPSPPNGCSSCGAKLAWLYPERPEPGPWCAKCAPFEVAAKEEAHS